VGQLRELDKTARQAGQTPLQPRSGGIGIARHGSAGKAKTKQSESASADGTIFPNSLKNVKAGQPVKEKP
jgi:hypothetical protein